MTFTMLVEYVKCGDEELMSILLFITGEMTSVCPDKM